MAQLTPEISDICSHCQQPIFSDDRARPSLTFEGVVMHPGYRTCHVGGVPVHLTLREFDMLYLLMSRAGRVCSKDTLFAVIWGLDSDVELKIIDVFICKLRKKLGPDHAIVQTVWGRGYCIGVERGVSTLR